MKKKYCAIGIFIIGAIGYSLIEIIWRGRTHWTMTLTGGTCCVVLSKLSRRLKNKGMLIKCIMGSLLITVIEFIVGCSVNLGLKMDVWDYKDQRFNLLGQICLLYSFLWFLLCIPVMCICGLVQRSFDLK